MARTPVRLWIAMGVAASLLLALVGWIFVVGPQRAKAADTWGDLTSAQAQSARFRSANSALAREAETIADERAALAVKRQLLPESDALESLVRSFAGIASTTGVTVEEVTASVPIDISAGVTGTTTGTLGLDATTTEGAATDAPAGEPAATDPTGTASTVDPVATASTYLLPVTLRASGAVADLEQFIRLIQSDQPRAILFSTLTFVPDTDGTSFDDSVMLTAETRVFVSQKVPPAAAANVTP